jgi:hypothetical protein
MNASATGPEVNSGGKPKAPPSELRNTTEFDPEGVADARDVAATPSGSNHYGWPLLSTQRQPFQGLTDSGRAL